MAVFLSESFTGVNGTTMPAHNAVFEELGWDMVGLATTTQHTIESNRCVATTATSPGARVVRCTTDPGADEYDLTATWQFRSLAQSNRWHALLVRMHPTATDYAACDHYRILANMTDAPTTLKMTKVVGGTATDLDSSALDLANLTAVVRVEVRTAGIQVYVNDVLQLETIDTAITQRGRIGFGLRRGDSSFQYMDDLTGDSVTGAAPNEVTTTIPLALALSADTAADHDVTATIPLDLDLTAAATVTHEVTAALPLSVLLAAEVEADHDVTTSFPLAVDVAPVAEAPTVAAEVTASIPLTLALAPATQTAHDATAAIPLGLLLAPESSAEHAVTAGIAMSLELDALTARASQVAASFPLVLAIAAETFEPFAVPAGDLTLRSLTPRRWAAAATETLTTTSLTPRRSLVALED